MIDAPATCPICVCARRKPDRLDWAPAPKDARRDGGSVFEATLSLVKICVGGGIYALPWAIMQAGALAVPGIVALAAWNWYTSWQLLAAREDMARRGDQATSSVRQRSAYSTLVHAALGPAGVLVLEGSLVTVLLGVCASFQIQAAQLLNAMIEAVR